MSGTGQTPSIPASRRVRWRGWVALILVLGAAAYVCIPRTADLYRFDPIEMARLETGMWRDYYQHKQFALAMGLYRVSRDQYHFSPLDSIRLASRAAKAAIVFKDSHNDAEADLAFPKLREYFDLINSRIERKFDVDEATRAELHWWKIRRHNVGPVEYGHGVARATSILYHASPDSLEPYAQSRCAAMDYRDKHGEKMTDADWDKVQKMLETSFSQLKQATSNGK